MQLDPNMRTQDPDSLNKQVEIISLPPKLYQWTISKELGNILPSKIDTLHHQFQNTNLTEGVNGEYNYLGNLGAPRMSRIFFDRQEATSTMFLDPYSAFVTRPEDYPFTNSNIPYTNLTYYKTFNRLYGEERFKSYFSVNVNKRLAFGFDFDYMYGRGYYQQQATSLFKVGVFGSYVGDKYQAHGIFNSYNMKMAENGGIADDRYVTNPEDMVEDGGKEYESYNMPIRYGDTKAWNYNKDFYLYYTHRYKLGFYRDIKIKNETDSIPGDSLPRKEFVPVTSFIHTIKVENAQHKFLTEGETEGLFDNTYLAEGASRDTTTYTGIKNTFGIALLEGFNKYAKAGLTAYISHKYSRYTLMGESMMPEEKFTENEVFVGGELAKRQGSLLHYNITGEVGLAGEAIGQFKVRGNADLNVRLGRDTVNLIARGSITNTLPAFYMRHYHSNHAWWDNDNMDKELRTRGEGEINIERWGTNIQAGLEIIKNYTYFDGKALPAQHGDNIKVASARLRQNFKLGVFHWDNEVTWQKTSNENVLPLPDFTIYSNFYIAAKLAKKVLSVELGADVRYFTEYYAPAYSPHIQQFNIQDAEDRVKLGKYPIINAYVNLHLKRTRLFVMYYHVNSGSGNSKYFLVPHYPINQSLFKFGLSWNFYD